MSLHTNFKREGTYSTLELVVREEKKNLQIKQTEETSHWEILSRNWDGKLGFLSAVALYHTDTCSRH